MSKSEMLQRSMRCFVLGWWSLVPLAGVALGILALIDFYAVTLRKGNKWNAARTRLTTGALLAGLGLLLSFILGTCFAIIALKSLIE